MWKENKNRNIEIGSIVETVFPLFKEKESKGYVELGALAEVVDGKSVFPDLYNILLNTIGQKEMDNFIWVKWIEEDPRYHGRINGAYAKYRFSESKNSLEM